MDAIQPGGNVTTPACTYPDTEHVHMICTSHLKKDYQATRKEGTPHQAQRPQSLASAEVGSRERLAWPLALQSRETNLQVGTRRNRAGFDRM